MPKQKQKPPTIFQWPEPVLSKRCTPFVVFGKELEDAVDTIMTAIETMPFGAVAGLAAPQVGIAKRVFVALGKVYVNPELRTANQKYQATEGCFSHGMGHETFKVWRYSTAWIKYQDMTGAHHEERHNGYAAEVLQHEYDHMQGITCKGRQEQN